MDINQSKSDFKAVVRNIKTNDFYFYLGGNSFRNIRTGQTGEVSDEAAQKVFKINIEASELINKYPMIEKLISTLSLRNCEK